MFEVLKKVDETGWYFPGVGALYLKGLVEWQHYQWGLTFLGHVMLAVNRNEPE